MIIDLSAERTCKRKYIGTEISDISSCGKHEHLPNVVQPKDVFKSHVFPIHRSPDRDCIELFPPMER